MSEVEWELVKIARARAMADRFEAEALARADAAGNYEMNARYAYALGYLAHEAARRLVALEDARVVPDSPPAQGAAALASNPPGAAAPPNLRVVYVPRESRK